MHQKNRNVPDPVNSYDKKLELSEITGDASFCTLLYIGDWKNPDLYDLYVI